MFISSTIILIICNKLDWQFFFSEILALFDQTLLKEDTIKLGCHRYFI